MYDIDCIKGFHLNFAMWPQPTYFEIICTVTPFSGSEVLMIVMYLLYIALGYVNNVGNRVNISVIVKTVSAHK